MGLYALGLLRRLLIAVGGIEPVQANGYTLHSLKDPKDTALSWALQLSMADKNLRGMFSRTAQLHVLRCVRLGVHSAPQTRGGLASCT